MIYLPEAMKEYMDIMEKLLELAHSATGQPDREWEKDRKESQQDENWTYLVPALSFIKELCSKESFVTKVSCSGALESTRFQRLALQHPDPSSAQDDESLHGSEYVCACMYIVCVLCAICVHMCTLYLYVYVFLCVCV